MKSKKLVDYSEEERGLGVILEDMNNKFNVLIEVTRPLPHMQAQIDKLVAQGENFEMRLDVLEKAVKDITLKLNDWEPSIKLIPVIFEEVGAPRSDVEQIKQRLDANEPRFQKIEERLTKVEEKIGIRA